MTLVVKCPACAKDVRWAPENTFRPFCSARCKQMDLGAWATERYRIGDADDEPSDGAAAGPLDGDPSGRRRD